MTDSPMTSAQREAVRRNARARAVRMGFATAAPEGDTSPPVKLPTLHFGALRALLDRGHLSPAQADEARRLFAEARQHGNALPSDTPQDAA
jgi:hypothetical protein